VDRQLVIYPGNTMITSIQLQNYKNHADTELTFGRLTALAGPNSSGKSNILDIVSGPGRLPDNGPFKMIFGDEPSPADIIRKGEDKCSGSIQWSHPDGQKGTLRWQIDHDSFPTQGPTRSTDTARFSIATSEEWEIEATDGGQLPLSESSNAPEWCVESFRGIRLLEAIGRRLQQPSFTKEIPPRLSEYGDYLPSVIAHHKLSNQKWVENLVHRVRLVVPALQDIRVQQVHAIIDNRGVVRVRSNTENRNLDQLEKVDQLLFDIGNAKGIKAKHVSEGTLFATLIFAALAEAADTGGPRTLVLDDIDQALHPKAQRDLIDVLRKMLDEDPNLQVIFSTHSPYIIDELSPDEVYLLNTDARGIAHAKTLSEHPDVKRATDVLTTGEFWSAEGEQWVIHENA
jgi:ABC-type Mn2+/Zn2+ transport system ATPase subunit